MTEHKNDMRALLLAICLCLLISADAFAQAVPCTAKTGSGLAACVNDAYPEKRKPTAGLAERKANAEFLRDRLIETARCAALDVGKNCKRGNCSDISADFIAWKTGGHTEGVDVIGSWDDLTRTISLGWHTYGPPDYGFPTYQAYGPVSCVGQPDPGPIPPNPGTPDLGPILSRLDALDANLADVRNHLADIRGIVSRETEDRQLEDNALRSEIAVIASKPIPTSCAAKGPFGIPVSCQLR